MIPSVARSGIARRHVARSVRGVDAFGRFSSLCAFGRQLAPLAPAGGAFFPIAHPHRGDAVPGAAKVSAVASGRYRRRGVAVLVPGAVDSLRRIPAPVGGPRGPDLVSALNLARHDPECQEILLRAMERK